MANGVVDDHPRPELIITEQFERLSFQMRKLY
jgi:hypothetical protein